MRTTLLYATVLLFLYSCNRAEEADANDTNTVTDTGNAEVQAPTEKIEEFQEFGYDDFNAVVIANDAPAYIEAKIDPMSPVSYDAYTLLKTKKGKREPVAGLGNDCHTYGYHWYEISNGEGDSYWMSGEYIYVKTGLNNFVSEDLLSNKKSFKVNHTDYYLGIMVTSFEDPQADEYIDCPLYALPFLYKNNSQVVYPFYAGNTTLRSCFEKDSNGNLVFVVNSDGCGAFVEDFKELESGVFELNVHMGFQDGGLNATFKIKTTDKGFEIVDFVTQDMYEG